MQDDVYLISAVEVLEISKEATPGDYRETRAYDSY